MDGSKSRTYSEQERQEALRLYVEVGPAEASKRTGIKSGTIRSWACRDTATAARSKTPGVAAERAEAAQAAVDAARLSWAQRQARVGRKAGAVAEALIDRVLEGMSPRNAADAMRAAALAIDKAQLLGGGATERVELSSDLEEARAQVTRMRDELAERRGRKAG